MNYKSYKVCQKCLGAIVRNGVIAFKKQGLGYRKEGKYFHKACLKYIRPAKLVEIFSI